MNDKSNNVKGFWDSYCQEVVESGVPEKMLNGTFGGARNLYEKDIKAGTGGVYLWPGFDRKSPNDI